MDQRKKYARFYYSVEGLCALISHNDLLQFLGLAVRRAGIPAWMTEGFNPHIWMAAGPAKPVGVGADNEFFDIALTNENSTEKELAERMNNAVIRGLSVNNVRFFSAKPLSVQEVSGITFVISALRHVDTNAFCAVAEAVERAASAERLVRSVENHRTTRRIILDTIYSPAGSLHIMRFIAQAAGADKEMLRGVQAARSIQFAKEKDIA